MSYLSNFKYDVFLSYAHKDNETLFASQEGWITQFYKHFKLQLDRYLEGTNTAEIWCDHELRKNYTFDSRIQHVIENSAIFLAFTSNSFFRSEYCGKELSLFCKTASSSTYGLKVKDCSRLFHIQLLNKHYTLWPPEFHGFRCYEMFKYLNDDSLKKEEIDQGITLSAVQDLKEYEKGLIEIVQDVCETLSVLKQAEAAPVVPAAPTKVFFGNVSHTLIPLREQIVKELQANDIAVHKCELPPPYDAKEHEEQVSVHIKQAELCLHLFDEIGGLQISNDSTKTFLQEQAAIAKNLNKEQLVFVSQELNLDRIPDATQRQFLLDLLKNKKSDSKYTLIKDFSVPTIVDHIKTKLYPPPPPPANDFILLDFNEVDFKYAVEYYNSLAIQKKVFLTTPGKSPIDFINSFEEGLKNVATVIIVWYEVAKEWIMQRITEIVSAIKTGRSKISKLSIYKDAELKDLDLSTLFNLV